MYLQKPPFETVYEWSYRPVFHLVYMRLLHREDAEDVVADTFIKAMEAYERFDPTRASVSTWLGRIAQNCTTDFLRRKGRRAEVGLEEIPDAGAEDRELSALTDEATAQVYRLMQHLHPAERQLVALRYGMELSNPEIGELLAISPKAVSDRLARLLKKCRKLAEELADDD